MLSLPNSDEKTPIYQREASLRPKFQSGLPEKNLNLTKVKLQFSRHVRSIGLLSKVHNKDLKYLALNIGTIIILWSNRLAPNLDCDEFESAPPLAEAIEVKRFVDWLCEQNFLDGAYWLSSAYSIWSGNDYRKQLAMYFTPPSLTKRLLDDLEEAGASFASHSFFDPACGGAAFLAPIAQRMRAALMGEGRPSAEIIRHVEENLFGIDLDPILCSMSKQFLRIVLADEIACTGATPFFHVAVADSLTEAHKLHGTFDVVVCNPPYRKMPAAEVSKHRCEYNHVIDSQPNLYGLFLTLGLKLLRPTGIAGFVTPTSFMSGRYFSKLRTHLLENADITSIGIVSDRLGVFIDVEQETALTILKRRLDSVSTYISPNVSVVSKQGNFKSVGSCTLPGGGCAWPIPRAEGDVDLIRIISSSKYRLVDYGFVPRTGCFVWNRDKRTTFYHLSEATAAGAAAPYPLLWSSDITTTGEVRFGHSKKAIQEPSYVDMVSESTTSILRRPTVAIQRVTSNDQPLRLVAGVIPSNVIQLHGGFVCENHVLALESATHNPKVPLDLLVTLLGSRPVDRYFRSISGSTNVSIFELLQLPLPEPARLTAMLEKGLSVDEAVLQAYL